MESEQMVVRSPVFPLDNLAVELRGFLILARGAAISLTTNNAENASQATKLLTWQKKLPALSETPGIKRVYSNRAA